jgi:hypothetical protein
MKILQHPSPFPFHQDEEKNEKEMDENFGL